MKFVVIGYRNVKNPTGPSNVIDSLLKGLDEIHINYTFINLYSTSFKEKMKKYYRILSLLFENNVLVNVHTYGYAIPSLVALISKVNTHNEYFLTVHGISSYENSLNNLPTKKEKRVIEKFLYEEIPNIICVSNYAKDIFLKLFNHPQNVYVVPNGLAEFCERYKEKNSMIFVYAGGYAKLKGPFECLIIFKAIYKKFPNALLTMCGPIIDEELFRKVQEFVVSNNLESNISIKQKLSKSELNKIYEESMFVLAPSAFDTFNMTVLEAMNKGCIPIVSENCGIKDILENECGIIYKSEKDVVKQIECIDKHIESKKSFELSLKNTYLDMTKKYLKIMERINE